MKKTAPNFRYKTVPLAERAPGARHNGKVDAI